MSIFFPLLYSFKSESTIGRIHYRKYNHNKNSMSFLCACVLSCFSHIQLFETAWTVVHQAPLFMGFSRQEYWIGLPFPSPEDLPNAGIEPMSLMSLELAGGFLPLAPSGKPQFSLYICKFLEADAFMTSIPLKNCFLST